MTCCTTKSLCSRRVRSTSWSSCSGLDVKRLRSRKSPKKWRQNLSAHASLRRRRQQNENSLGHIEVACHYRESFSCERRIAGQQAVVDLQRGSQGNEAGDQVSG